MSQAELPLYKRIYSSSVTVSGNPYGHTSFIPRPPRPVSYKVWSNSAMESAIDAVVKKGFSVRRAAMEYDVPRSTLNDRISGRCIHGKRSGPSRYLSEEEEEELVHFLLRCAAIGYPRTRQEVLAIVSKALKLRGIDCKVTHGWWESFCKRHDSLSLRTTIHLSISRAKASSEEVLTAYFDALEETLTHYHLLDKPSQIFNVDETGMPLNPGMLKGIFKRGERNPSAISSDQKNNITVVGCVNAAGHCLPPMVIWKRKTLHPDLTIGEIPGTFYGLSPNGWIDQELFHMWFKGHFLRYAPSVRPLLLLMDGHSSHYSPDTINLAAESDIIIFTLPPNTTHLSQPLDKGCFAPLKTEWKNVCHQYMIANTGRVVTQYSFSTLLSQAWMKAMTMKNIVSGFRVTGVFPLDRSKLLSKVENPFSSKSISFNPMLHKRSDSEHPCSYKRLSIVSTKDAPICSSPIPVDSSVFLTPMRPVSAVKMVYQRTRPLKDILKYPSPVPRPPPVYDVKSARVLTSSENLAKLNERQQLKEEKQREKEMRAKARELKKTAVKKKGKTTTCTGIAFIIVINNCRKDSCQYQEKSHSYPTSRFVRISFM